jgi:hypothetical protein
VVSLAGGSIPVKDHSGEESLLAWLAVVEREMAAADITGLIHATPASGKPRWLRDVRGPRLTAFVAHDENFQTSPLEQVAALCQAGADWTTETPGKTYVSVAGMSQIAPATGAWIGPHLARAVRARTIVTLMRAPSHIAPVAQVAYLSGGYVVYQAHHPSAPALTLLDRIREALLIGAGQMRLGFVAAVDDWAITWPDRKRALPALPTISADALRLNTPLWRQYVPDAHALQLLTDEHLRHVHDLSRWNVTQVAPGRHLVEATNLDDWFTPEGPSDSVIRQARADFGNAIIPADALTEF